MGASVLVLAGLLMPAIATAPLGGIFNRGAGRSSIISNGEWLSNGHYSGPDVFHADGVPTFQGVVYVNHVNRVLCVIDGTAVVDAVAFPPRIQTVALESMHRIESYNCVLDMVSAGSMHSVAMYAASKDGTVSLIGNPALFTIRQQPADLLHKSAIGAAAGATATAAAPSLAESAARMRQLTPAGTGILGVYYTTYQQETSQVYQNITKLFGWTYSMEEVLRNTSLMLSDSIWKWAPAAAYPEFSKGRLSIMQHQPQLGIYCYYRKRENETYGYIPDCPEASNVLRTHASEMVAAGFAFIAPDATNWDQDPRNASNGADLHQLRPTEVIAEEWAAMRANGEATPAMSTFDQVNAGGVLYQWYLSEFFNNQTLLELGMILKTSMIPGWNASMAHSDSAFNAIANASSTSAAADYKVYIVADEPTVDWSSVHAIQSNGGAYDVITPFMWAAPAPGGGYEAEGYLKYYSPCVSRTTLPHGTVVDTFSNDVPIDLDFPCNHYKTHKSPLGPVWTVSTATPINSVPFSGTKLNGLFLKKQFYDIFADPEPTSVIFAPSWNEYLVGPVNSSGWDITNPYFFVNGLSFDDPDRNLIFVDGQGSERSRTIEPSKSDGGYYYELMASCMRVYRVQASLGIVSNGTGCDVQGEECCTINPNQVFTRVWSLDAGAPSSSSTAKSTADAAGAASDDGAAPSVADSILSSDRGEYEALIAGGGVEICSPWVSVDNGQATGFCVNGSMPWAAPDQVYPPAYDILRGPFLLYANTSTSVPDTVPLYRCSDAGAGYPRHFVASGNATMSGAAACIDAVGGAVLDYTLGYAGASRTSLTVREIRRCYGTAARPSSPPHWYTAVAGPCAPGDADQGIQGFGI